MYCLRLASWNLKVWNKSQSIGLIQRQIDKALSSHRVFLWNILMLFSAQHSDVQREISLPELRVSCFSWRIETKQSSHTHYLHLRAPTMRSKGITPEETAHSILWIVSLGGPRPVLDTAVTKRNICPLDVNTHLLVVPRPRIRGHIKKFPDWVDNKIQAYNNKHSLRNNTNGYGGKIH
jgi:hypothetical protein